MTLYLPIGPPGCGKSTLAADLVAEGLLAPDAIVCPDTYRQLLTGSRSAQHENERVFSICNSIAAGRMVNELDVWFDATNLPPSTTLPALALRMNVPVVNVLFDLPVSVLWRRNRERIHSVPDDVLRRFIGTWVTLRESELLGEVVLHTDIRSHMKVSNQ